MIKLFRVPRNKILKNVSFLRKCLQKNKHENWSSLIGHRGCKLVETVSIRRYSTEDSSKNIVSSPLGTVNIPEILFHDFVFENWSLWHQKTAIECVQTGRKYTYKALLRHSKALAAAFQKKFGLSKGDTLAVILPNCPEYPIVILAASMNGIISTTVNPVYTVHEMRRQFEDCNVKLLVTDVKTYETCSSVVEAMKASIPILVIRHKSQDRMPHGGVDLFELFNSSFDFKPADIQMDDTLILPYSSGTTGGPKGVILTHRMIVSNMKQISHPETNLMTPTTAFTQYRTFAVLPMFHIYGMVVCTFFCLREGTHIFVLPEFKSEIFVKSIYQRKLNLVYVVPPLFRVLSHKLVAGRYLKSVEFIVNGASALPVREAYTILDKAEHVKIVQGYGMTETSPVLAHTSTRRMQKLTSIGIPIASTKLKVVNVETGEALPRGQEGELCAWGPQIMKTYLNQPENTANAFDKEGWFRTGDIAYYDEDSDFFIVQRMKELIKVKGFQVAPYEVEETLMSHPQIKEVVVIGIPDPEYGEVPRAFVVLQKGAQVTEDEIKNFVKEKLAHYKQLRGGVRFLDELPKNNVGKVLRLELKKLP